MAHRPQHIIKIMATQTPFDLNAAFEAWRNELAAQPQLSSDDRRELERHLADGTAELRQRGLNEEEAFWLARRRIGQPQQLAEEFERAEPLKAWRERAFWMAASALALTLWMDVSHSLLTMLIVYLRPGVFLLYSLAPFHIILFGYLPFVLAIVLIATGRMGWLARRSAIIIHSQTHLAFIAALLVALSFLVAELARWLGEEKFPILMMSLLSNLPAERIVPPLIFVLLLCLFMPRRAKTQRRKVDILSGEIRH
jgi:hypothetical protein